MAEVNTGDGGGGHGKHEKKRAKKASTRIDMTPMVDLAFLLLTFFVLTSTFSKPKTLEVLYPVDPEDTTKIAPIKNGLTFLVGKDNKVYYYSGEFRLPDNKEGKEPTTLKKTDYSSEGIRKVLLDRNKWLRDKIAVHKERLDKKEIADSTYKRLVNDDIKKTEAVTVLIKPDKDAVFKNIIDIVDEIHITQVGKMAVVDITKDETALLSYYTK